jgi:predicted nucleotidyltransferase
MIIKDITRDFEDFKDDALGILLFGSYSHGEETQRSDIDICLVKPLNNSLVKKIDKKLGGKYDLKVFEDLPLFIQIEIIGKHTVISGNKVDLSAYFYRFRKLWEDMIPRIQANRFTSVGERMALRRRWMDEKRSISGKIGNL